MDFEVIKQDPATWVAVSTVIFALAAFKPLSKMLLGALDARSIKIRSELEEASKLRVEAEELLNSYRAKYELAVSESQEIIATARNEASKMLASAKNEIDLIVKKRMESVMQRIDQAEKAAVNDIQVSAIDIAVNATKTIIKEKLQSAHSDELITYSIGELQRKLH